MKQKVCVPQFSVVVSALLMTALLSLCPAFAEEDKGYQEYSLGEIVVSGKGSAVQDIATANTLTPEDFKATNATSVADALTYVPGVQVTYGRKASANINIRGFDQNRILTLIDGVPYYETKYGGMDLNQIGLEGVARIDVVKGAPSVLYGPNALGGVVNIITKKAAGKPVFSATAEYGADGIDDAYKVGLSHGMQKGILNYWLSYSHREWDSWDLSDDFEPRTGTIKPPKQNTIIQNRGTRVNSDYQTDNFWAKVGVEPSEDTEVYLNFHYINTEKGDPPNIDMVKTFSDFTQFDRITDYNDWGVDLSAEHAFTDDFRLQAKLFYHDHADDYTSYSDQTYTQQVAMSSYNDAILGGMLLGDYRIVDWDTLRFSLHYKEDFHEQRDLASLPFAESTAYTGSVGLENESTLVGDKLAVVAGISYDWYDISKAEDDPGNTGNIVSEGTPGTSEQFNPMLGATYQVVDSVKLYASVAKKTRFPTLSQIYSGNKANLELEAETAINYTAGFAWAFSDLFTLDVAPFFSDISDYITRDVPPAVNPYSQYKNYDEVEMLGVEGSVVVTPYRDLLFKIGFMTNNATNKSEGRVTDEVLNVPEYTFNFGIEYIVPVIRTKLNWTTLYMGESYSQLPTAAKPTLDVLINDNYTVCNAKITQPFMSERLKVFLSVENLLDEDYEPNTSFPAPGLRAWLGLSYDM